MVRELYKQTPTFEDLGKHLYALMLMSPTPLGNFVRSYCTAAQPPIILTEKRGTSGDLLPTPPWSVSTDIPGVTEGNEVWIKAILCVINFHYCVGWSKPICVPFKDGVTPLQIAAISQMAEVASSNIVLGTPLKTLGESERLLTSKRYDYSGNPIEYMENLVCEKVLPAWPRPGQAGIQPIEAFVKEETKALLAEPAKLLLPPDKIPEQGIRSRVRASEAEWFNIVHAAHQRGMMKPVDDTLVPRDRQGHLITNGAGGVVKEKMIDGKVHRCQRFISVLCPINAVMGAIAGSQDTLPYIGQLIGILLEEDEGLYLDSEDLQSAFNLFSMPDNWLPYFAYSKKVDSAAFGMPPGTLIRPALSVVPMGWHSAVALVQEAVRTLVFERAKIPRQYSIEKHRRLPEEQIYTIVYLDNFDEIHVVKSLDMELQKEGVELSPHHAQFIEACDSAGRCRANDPPIQEGSFTFS